MVPAVCGMTSHVVACMPEQVLPKVIWEEPRHKVPIGYNGMPRIQPQSAPSPSTITTPI